MAFFSRRSRWLNFLFPASVAPQVRDPASRSDDVSLVQPYDGSGWPIPDPAAWIITAQASGISGEVDLLTVPEGFVYRLFLINTFRISGAATDVNVHPNIFDLISVPNVAVAIADMRRTDDRPNNNISFLFEKAIVVPAGLTIRMQHFTGAAGTEIQHNMYGCLAPAGTVFYC